MFKNRNASKWSTNSRGFIIGDALEKNIVSYLEAVYSVQSLFAATEAVDREQFKEFVARTLDRIPGIQALSWNPRISQQQRVDYETAARSQGYTDFNITERGPDGKLIPALLRPEYIIVWYIEPYRGNEKVFGYDVYPSVSKSEKQFIKQRNPIYLKTCIPSF